MTPSWTPFPAFHRTKRGGIFLAVHNNKLYLQTHLSSSAISTETAQAPEHIMEAHFEYGETRVWMDSPTHRGEFGGEDGDKLSPEVVMAGLKLDRTFTEWVDGMKAFFVQA